MLQKIIFLPLFIGLFLTGLISYCSVVRQNKITESQRKLNDAVKIGDNIFKAKGVLESKGFRIDYGPKFPTASKSYYMMLIDYGLRPTAWDTFKYGVEWPASKNQKRIFGAIEADKNGEIYRIE